LSKISGITTVCFDIDWTLISHQSDEAHRLLRLLGLEHNHEFEKQVSNFWENLSSQLQNGKPVEKHQVYSIAEKFIPYLREINLSGKQWYNLQCSIDTPELIEGAYEILEYLQNQGYFIVASTNGFIADQMNILKKLDILYFFERIYAWDTTCAKPHARSLYSLLSTHSNDAVIFIGDSVYTDIKLANKLGIKSIGFNLKYKKGQKRIKPTAQISKLHEIKYYL